MADFVLVTHADSQFGFMDTVAAEVAAGFRATGRRAIATHLLDGRRMAEASAIIGQGDLAMVVLMNGIGMEGGTSDLVRFLASLQVPVVGFFLDHPAYHHHRVATPVPRLVVATSCSHDGGFIRRFIRDDVPVRTVHHGATRVPDGIARPWAERDIDVLVPSTLPLNPEADRPKWAERYGAVVAAQLNAVVELHDADPARALHDVILEVLAGRAMALKDVLPYYCVADLYLRARIKLASVRALLAAGVRVTVLSAGWPDDLGERAVRLPAVPMAEGFALMGRTRLVLNHLPPYLQSHERPLQAALCGAAAGSTPSAWVEQATGGHALMLPLATDEAAATVAAALADPGLAHRAALAGATVADGQLWEHRAAEIAAVAGLTAPAA